AHPILRSSFAWEQAERPLQVVRADVRIPFDILDLRGAENPEAEVDRLNEADRRRGFELATAPLVRVRVMRTEDSGHHVLCTFHHILLDGWSLSSVLGEVFTRYGGSGSVGDAAAVRPYCDYIAWLQDQDLHAAETYWREKFAGFSSVTQLGIERSAASEGGHTGPGVFGTTLPTRTTEALAELARARGLTLNTLTQGVWALLLSRYSRSQDVVFGATVSGRPSALAGVESMVGLFINTLPVRVRVDSGTSVGAWLEHLQREQLELRQYEYSPLADVQRWSEIPAGEPLFESLFVFENYPLGSVEGDPADNGLDITPLPMTEQTNYPLTAIVMPGEALSVQMFYDQDRFHGDDIGRLGAAYVELLEQIAASSLEAPIAGLSLLGEDERRRVLWEWNDTAVDHPGDLLLHEVIAERARLAADATAVEFAGARTSYAELDARANSVAHALVDVGVGAGSLVGVCLERGLDVVPVLLGVWKAGAGYVPLDPDYPADRLEFIVADADVDVLVTTRSLVDRMPAFDGVVLAVEEIDGPASDPDVTVAPDDVAYVIYTSGSTGRPKGVAVEHGGLVRRVLSLQDRYPLSDEDRVMQKTPLTFDVSVLDLFWPLAAGSVVVMARPGGHADAGYLAQAVADERITVLHFVPSMLEALLDYGFTPLARLRLVFCMGEALTTRLVDRFGAVSGAELHDGYGPTEATIAMIFSACAPGTPGVLVPIGRPIANTDIYILDDAMEPVPPGVPGELFIGGVGIARGYVGRPGLTAERFVADPFGGVAGARLYRTGDLARYRPDGVIEFLGRLDDQVKVRGFRVEPGEIEAFLASHPAVRDAVVVVRRQQLVAYLTPAGDTLPGVAELREYAGQSLPEYMVPAVFVVLDALPLTPSGKLDRRALPDPETGRLGLETGFVAARTETETILAVVWAEVLGVERVGV
ncbi:amino acid adenylation domain-containing protein, partial [Streptomyces sp. YPW6]|uniref:amino acid adenylation domain-containing protein n=1 Tax=Streptomyces sp. YPW6 TaxID=2840373 RepID=UPI003D74C396